MRNKKEFVGTLSGFDDFVSKNSVGYFTTASLSLDMVLTDVTE